MPFNDPRFDYIFNPSWDFNKDGTITITDIWSLVKSVFNTPGNLTEYLLSKYYYTDFVKFFEIADAFPVYDTGFTYTISFIFWVIVFTLLG